MPKMPIAASSSAMAAADDSRRVIPGVLPDASIIAVVIDLTCSMGVPVGDLRDGSSHVIDARRGLGS